MVVGRHNDRVAGGHITLAFRKQRRKQSWTHSFLLSLDPEHGVMMPTFRAGLRFLVNPSLETLSRPGQKVCLLGDSKSSQLTTETNYPTAWFPSSFTSILPFLSLFPSTVLGREGNSVSIF